MAHSDSPNRRQGDDATSALDKIFAARAYGPMDARHPLYQMVELSSDLISLSDREGTLTYLNPAGRRLIGVDDLDINRINVAEYMTTASARLLRDVVYPALAQTGVWEGEVELVNRKTGARINAYRSTFALHDRAGGITCYATVKRDISTVKAEEERLRGMAESFYGIVANAPFGIYVVDGDFRLREVSQGARKVFASVRPLIGHDLAQALRKLWPEPFASQAIERFRHTLETGEPYQAPLLVERRADIGETQSYDWRIERVVLPEGRHGVVCYFYDLSERQRWSEALSKSERRTAKDAAELRHLYAQAPIGLALLDADLRFVRINSALAEANGFPVEAHIGRCVWDLLPNLRESAEPALMKVLRSGEPLRDVAVVGETPARPGARREWREFFYPVREADGAISGIGIICEDVTDKQEAERQQRAGEEHLRRLLDQLFAFVGTLAPDGTMIYANSAPLEAAGIALSDVADRHFADTYWWAYDPKAQDGIRRAVARAARGETVRYDVPVQIKDGQTVTIDFQMSPLRDSSGAITHLIPTGVIVEERVHAEAELRRLADELERRVEQRTAELVEVNRQLAQEIQQRETAQAALLQSQKLEALGQLTSGVAHDFNNMIAAIMGGFSVIQRRISDPMLLEVASHGLNAAQRGATLVKQLLSFARQQSLAPRRLDMAAVLAEAEPLARHGLGPEITFTIDCAPDAWPVLADATQLQSALLNLCVNARDAMPDGGALSVTVENMPAEGAQRPTELGDRDAVCITVADTGVGMTSEVLRRVMEPFFTTKPPGKGTGLGLAMVHGFIHQSGGAMRIESSPGAGASFRLYLPRAQADDTAESAPVEETAKRGAVRRGHILVVDDDSDVRGVTLAELADLGYQATGAADAQEALALLDAQGFEAVLTDVVMPHVDGITLAAIIRNRWPALPVAFMTARADRSKLSGEAVIDKPFTTRALDQALAALLMKAG